jgi:tetratricopeptide (TPR) repeat protein
MALAQRLAAQDVLLAALLDTLAPEHRRFAAAAAVYRRGVPREALDAVAQAAGPSLAPKQRNLAIAALQLRSLLASAGERQGSRTWTESFIVHRWTADSLLAMLKPDTLGAVHRAAAGWWQAHAHPSWEDHLDALEHLLLGKQLHDAQVLAERMLAALTRYGQALSALALCERMERALPAGSLVWALWHHSAADQLRLLGSLSAALERFNAVHQVLAQICAAERDNHDASRTLGVLLSRLGDLHRALGDGNRALQFFQDALAIAQRLAQRDPDNADWQRDLSISFDKLGDLHRALGDGNRALQFFQDSLTIAQRLAQRDPDNADWQRDLAISYERMGAVDADQAVSWLERAIAIRRRVFELDGQDAVAQRELGVALFQRARSSQDEAGLAALHESYQRLQALRERGALDADFHPLVDALGKAVEPAGG